MGHRLWISGWILRISDFGVVGGPDVDPINTSPPFKGLNLRILIIIPLKGSGFINQLSGLCRVWSKTGT